MRFFNLFLVGYAILVIGGGIALWQVGVLGRLSPIWIVVSILVMVGIGIMLAVSSGKPGITQETRR